MAKPVYKYPDFITDITLEKTDTKRYWLRLVFDDTKNEEMAVVLKNPSRADNQVSDKTVYNVSNYIYKNRDKYPEFKDVGSIIILNLIPLYQTYSDRLASLKHDIIDPDNLNAINKFTSQCKNVIIAWGNHPEGLFDEYEQLKTNVFDILSENNNMVLYVDRLSKAGNPKHGQIWAYRDALIQFN